MLNGEGDCFEIILDFPLLHYFFLTSYSSPSHAYKAMVSRIAISDEYF